MQVMVVRLQTCLLYTSDLLSAADVIKMQEQTDCDGFMIGRGAQGNPWIFKQILHYFQTGEQLDKPSDVYKRQVDILSRNLNF